MQPQAATSGFDRIDWPAYHRLKELGLSDDAAAKPEPPTLAPITSICDRAPPIPQVATFYLLFVRITD